MQRKQELIDALGAGVAQGLTFNWADDALAAMGEDGLRRAVAQAQKDRPGVFGAGNILGNLVSGGVIGSSFVKGATQGGKAGLDFMRRAMATDAAMGAAYGAGGYRAGERDALQRLGDGAIGAGVGALTAGLVPTAFRVADDIYLNAPVFRGGVARHADQSLIAAENRSMDDLVLEAMARDEAIARRAMEKAAAEGGRRPTIFGRYGETARPVDIEGGNVQSLFDVAARNPKARQSFNTATDKAAREEIEARLKRMRTPLLQKDADGVYAVRSQDGKVEQVSLFVDLKDARNQNLAIAEQRRRQAIGNDVTASSALLVDDLYKALDDPAAHKEWLSLAKRMAADEPAAAFFMAQTMAHSLRSRARAAKGDDLIELEQRLSPSGDLTAKFKALGVTPRAQKEPGPRIRTDRDRLARADRDVARPYDQRQPRFSAASDNMDAREANALTPRGRQTPENSPGIAFSEEDSLNLVEALNRARRVNYIPPSSRTGPLLATRAEPGFKWSNPLVGDAGVSMAGWMAGKLAPGVVEQAIHGGGVTYLPQELMEFANADPRYRPRRAAPVFAYG